VATNETPTILIVDDDRSIQRLLADALAQEGFSVAVERDGEWAVDTFNKRPVDAIVLDLLLPAINGYEVARIIRSTPRGQNTPIIMISGVYKSAIHQREALEKHGAHAFIEKPIRLSALLDALRTALGGRYPQRPEPVAFPLAASQGVEQLADPHAQEEAGLVERQSEEASAAIGIKGNFRQRPFPEVLADIFHSKGTGALLLRRDKVKKIAYFREGQPLSIKSNLLSECLGRVMVHERIISEAECEESIRRMKIAHRRQGAILIEMGSISPHNLVYALNLQLRLKLFEVFAWDHGEYRFNPRIPPPSETVNLEMSTAAVVYEGVRRHFDVARLRHSLGEADELYIHRSNSPAYPLFDAGLGEEEQLLLQAIDGSRTVADLRALELLSPLDTDRLLYAMKCAGLVDLKKHPQAEAQRVAAAGGQPEPVTDGAGDPEAGSWSDDEAPDASNDAQLIAESTETPPSLRGGVGEIGLAEAKFQLGEELLRERQYEAAHQLFAEAVQISGGAAQFHAYAGWSQFQMRPDDPACVEAALSALAKAISLNPTVDKSYLFSGYIYKALGQMDQAESHFEKAIQCNPDCEEALQELKALTEARR
jgi:DNA-binding response OmpR family regulator/tetratricopeptide (TPR) repeat protein